jgi:hypothetical protein
MKTTFYLSLYDLLIFFAARKQVMHVSGLFPESFNINPDQRMCPDSDPLIFGASLLFCFTPPLSLSLWNSFLRIFEVHRIYTYAIPFQEKG